MSKVLCTTLPSNDLGLLARTVPVARELASMGHKVAYCNPAPAPSKLIAEAGLENLTPPAWPIPTAFAPSTMDVWDLGHFWALIGFLDDLGRSRRVRVIHVTPELEANALIWLRRHDERSYSFVDATSFAVMRSMKIRDALAFDGDFTAAGLRELRV